MLHNPGGDCNWEGRYEDITVGRQIYIYHKLPVAYLQFISARPDQTVDAKITPTFGCF